MTFKSLVTYSPEWLEKYYNDLLQIRSAEMIESLVSFGCESRLTGVTEHYEYSVQMDKDTVQKVLSEVDIIEVVDIQEIPFETDNSEPGVYSKVTYNLKF